MNGFLFISLITLVSGLSSTASAKKPSNSIDRSKTSLILRPFSEGVSSQDMVFDVMVDSHFRSCHVADRMSRPADMLKNHKLVLFCHNLESGERALGAILIDFDNAKNDFLTQVKTCWVFRKDVKVVYRPTTQFAKNTVRLKNLQKLISVSCDENEFSKAPGQFQRSSLKVTKS